MLLSSVSDLGPAGTPAAAFSALYSAVFGSPTALTFTATACFVPASASSVAILCTSGAGNGLVPALRVGGQAARIATGAAVSYRPPTLSALSGSGFANAQTEGGQTVLLSGDQFGPVSVLGGAFSPLPNVTAAYGLPSDSPLRYTAVSCAVTTAQTVITCLTAPGVGFGYLWQVSVAGQVAPLLQGFRQRYAPPVTAIYSGPGSLEADTAGGQLVVLSGA